MARAALLGARAPGVALAASLLRVALVGEVAQASRVAWLHSGESGLHRRLRRQGDGAAAFASRHTLR